jgi:protein TonB
VAVQPHGDFDVGYDARTRAQPARSPKAASEPADEGLELAGGQPSGPDLSRSPALASGGALSCPFPAEAKRRGIDSAVVTLRVEVEANNQVESVIVLADPGDGFGHEARRCALSKRWQAGLDRAGRAARRTTVVSVRFQRNG